MASLMPLLISDREGQPEIGSEVSAVEWFSKTPWSDWPEGKFTDVIRYLRGNKSLHLPQRWRNVLPERL